MQSIKNLSKVFSGFTKEEFENLKWRLKQIDCNVWDELICMLEKNDKLFFIKEWIVKFQFTYDDKTFVSHFLQSSDCFWYVSLFTHKPSRIEAKCMSWCKIYYLDQDDLDYYVANSTIFVYNLFNAMSETIQIHQQIISNLAFSNVKVRIIKKLIYLAKLFWQYYDPWEDIWIPLTQQEFANYVWSARENVAKILASYKKDWYIDLKTKNIIIKNLKWLKKLDA